MIEAHFHAPSCPCHSRIHHKAFGDREKDEHTKVMSAIICRQGVGPNKQTKNQEDQELMEELEGVQETLNACGLVLRWGVLLPPVPARLWALVQQNEGCRLEHRRLC